MIMPVAAIEGTAWEEEVPEGRFVSRTQVVPCIAIVVAVAESIIVSACCQCQYKAAS